MEENTAKFKKVFLKYWIFSRQALYQILAEHMLGKPPYLRMTPCLRVIMAYQETLHTQKVEISAFVHILIKLSFKFYKKKLL